MSTTIEKLLPQLTLIDDLVKWKMRRSYWRVMFSPLEPNDRAWLLSYVDRKWRDIHGQCSPKGQLPLNAVGSVNSRFKAQHLAAAYNAVIYAAHHEIDPAYQKAPQCSACNRVAVQGVVKRRYRS
ncbi:hypothetical protein [Acidihalobacter ferrooxydans]|uniref:Uncharacterized protein n=1 Tax=Acidihalobacter ferrooxydans TaxID=1765967 RepID=A0A1P8UFI3_9GAMM|nr:hypothetical protein [Acidihalobacter ferrooxydans]APZ42578.1 hypothetical protein BW247_05265 [Acidihalobacter ferrooxydans]